MKSIEIASIASDIPQSTHGTHPTNHTALGSTFGNGEKCNLSLGRMMRLALSAIGLASDPSPVYKW
jgi:hypothetical protein